MFNFHDRYTVTQMAYSPARLKLSFEVGYAL